MTNEFIPYEQALQLKELGFNEECFGFYDDQHNKDNRLYLSDSINLKGRFIYTKAPIYSQAFRFFREKYPYRFYILPCSQHKKFLFEITLPSSIVYTSINDNAYDTYEEAEQACLNKLIQITKANLSQD